MPIQKDGGCQFMTCQVCRVPYCWDCMKVLARDHEPHPCKKEDVKLDAHNTKSRNELQDYSRCVGKFDEFMNKGKAYALMRAVEKKKQTEYNYMVSDNFSNFRFYEDALDVLIESARVAKYSFVFQFYSRDNPADLDLFLYNQQFLITEVEQLEASLKRDTILEQDKAEFQDKIRSARIRTLTVTKSVEEGLTRNADLYRIQA